MRRLLPLFLSGLLTACAASGPKGNIEWNPHELFTDVPTALHAALRGSGIPNVSAITETQVRSSTWLRTNAYSLENAEDGLALLGVRYVTLAQDEKTGAIRRSGCTNDSGNKVYSATRVMLGGGLFLAGGQDTTPCGDNRQHYHEVANLSGQLFPMAVGNRLSFEVTGKIAYQGRNLGWRRHERYSYEIADKQNGYTNGFVSVTGDVFRIRVTIEDLERRNSQRTNELLWSEALKWVIARKRGNWGQGNHVDTWLSETVAFSGSPLAVGSAARKADDPPASAKRVPSDEELWQITLAAFRGETLKPLLAALRAEEAQRQAEHKRREAQRKSDRETTGQLLGFASALVGGMMASEGARTGNSALINQGSELLVRGGVAAATGDHEDVTSLTQTIVNQSTQGTGASTATGSAATAGGPQFTPQQEEQIAGQLTQRCKADPLYTRQMAECQTNKLSQAPCYHAAARLCECFLQNDPRQESASDPRAARHHAEWRKCVVENRQNAGRLGSNTTIFDPNRR